jgi:hypothetical protein
MHRSTLYSVSSISLALAQTIPGATIDACPAAAPGPWESGPGWDLRNYLYMVNNELDEAGNNVATARITFDLVGGFTNQPVHCEAAGPELLANHTGIDRWRPCVPKAGSPTSSEYATMFRYSPSDPWHKLTLRETATCGADADHMYGQILRPWAGAPP